MRPSDWAEAVARINRMWPQRPVAAETAQEWFELVVDLAPEKVKSAITALAMEGREFAPHGGQIRQKAMELEDSGMTFEQAWGTVQRAVTLYGSYRQKEAEEDLASVPEALDLVALMGGWLDVCRGGPDPDSPMDPGVWYSQARNAWLARSAQHKADLAVATLPGRRGEAARLRVVGPQHIELPAGFTALLGAGREA